MAAIVVAVRKRQKLRFVIPKQSNGDQDDAKSDSSEVNAGAAIDEEFEDSNSLLGVMPTPSTALMHGTLHKVDFRGDWSLRQGILFNCVCELM